MLGETLEEYEAVENALEVEGKNSDLDTSKSEEPVSVVKFGDALGKTAEEENKKPGKIKVGKTVEVENKKPREAKSEEGEEKVLADGDGENGKASEMNGDHILDEDTYTSGDDEEDDLWRSDDGEGGGDDDSDEGDEEETTFDEDADDEDNSEAIEEEPMEGADDEDNSEGNGEETAFDKERVREEDDVQNAEAGKEIAKEDGKEAEDKNAEKACINKKRARKSKGWGEMNKLSEDRSPKVAQGENSKSAKKKSKKKVESMGMIFMCSSKTKSDCFKYKVLGLPESKKSVVEKIYSGMRLFLYDIDLKLMYGIYKAQGPGGYNIVTKAFKSKFPSQVRFSILRDCLPLAEEKFRTVIKENYFTNKKFDGQLNSEQVKKLCKMFVSISKGTPTKRLPRSRNAEKQPIPVRRENRKAEPIPVRRENRKAEKKPLPVRRIGKRKQRADDRKRPPLREKDRHMERPPKRTRRAISPISRSHQPPLSGAPLVALDRNLDVDPYRRGLYLDSRDRDHYRRDPYESRRDGPTDRDLYLERRDPYRDGRDPYLDRRDPYRNGQEIYLDRRAPHTETRDPYPDRHAPHTETRDPYPDRHALRTETRDPYPDRRIRYRDEQDPYPVPRDPYRDAQDMYLTRPVYKDVRAPEPYDPYRRKPLPDSRVVYREDRSVAFRDPYRLEEVVERPLSLERRRYDTVSQDPYASYRSIPSNGLPLYSAEYTSRGLTREYRL